MLLIKILRCSVLIIIVFFSVSGLRTLAQSATERYVAKHRNIAATLATEFGIPREVIMSVAIIESSAGEARNCRDLNNHFGIVGINHIARHTRYKQYTTVLESFRDFCLLMARKSFYARLRGNADPLAWTDAISKCGYSEQPGVWKSRMITVMKTNML